MYSGGNNIGEKVLATALGCSQTRRSWSCYGFHVSYMHLHSFLQLAWLASFFERHLLHKKHKLDGFPDLDEDCWETLSLPLSLQCLV